MRFSVLLKDSTFDSLEDTVGFEDHDFSIEVAETIYNYGLLNPEIKVYETKIILTENAKGFLRSVGIIFESDDDFNYRFDFQTITYDPNNDFVFNRDTRETKIIPDEPLIETYFKEALGYTIVGNALFIDHEVSHRFDFATISLPSDAPKGVEDKYVYYRLDHDSEMLDPSIKKVWGEYLQAFDN